MEIIKYSIKYLSEAKLLLNTFYGEETSPRFLDSKNTVLGFIDKKLVGLAGFGRNALHERIVNEYICVDIHYRRRGFGIKLHQELMHSFPLTEKDLAIDISCFEGEDAEEAFILKLGFEKYLDCYLCTFDLSEAVTDESVDDVFSLKGVPSEKEEVKFYYIRRYNEEHEKYLPVTKNQEVWDDYYCDGDNDELSAVMLRDDRIIGCSFFHLDIFEDKNIVCINGYATGRTVEEEVSNLKSIYSFQMDKISKTDYRKVYIEVDSTERVAELLLKWLPVNSKKVFKRYQIRI